MDAVILFLQIIPFLSQYFKKRYLEVFSNIFIFKSYLREKIKVIESSLQCKVGVFRMARSRRHERELLGHFPFVRTDRPDHSCRNDSFPFNQNSPARSVKF